MAHRKWTQRVILIGPGLAPKSIINKNFKITIDSQTSAVWSHTKDQHIDPIKPESPFSIAMFYTNYLITASKIDFWFSIAIKRRCVYLFS